MGLCGSTTCGCGLTSSPATAGEIGGELPTINVAGSGAAGDPWDLTLNDAWATEVVDELTRLGTRVGCNLRRAATQSATGSSAVTISWDTEDEDTDGFITVTSTNVTIPAGLGGIYAVSLTATGAGVWSDGTICYVQIDGSTFALSGIPGTLGLTIGATYVGPIAAAQVITALVRNNGSTQNMTAELSVYRVSD